MKSNFACEKYYLSLSLIYYELLISLFYYLKCLKSFIIYFKKYILKKLIWYSDIFRKVSGRDGNTKHFVKDSTAFKCSAVLIAGREITMSRIFPGDSFKAKNRNLTAIHFPYIAAPVSTYIFRYKLIFHRN